jgi:AbrB family looped-hinge helix DNA binding protein
MATQQTFTVRVQGNGRLTIPEPIRALLDLKENHFVKLTIEKID